MITIREMLLEEAARVKEIDRSESIELIYRLNGSELEQLAAKHECSNWNENQLRQLVGRFEHEVNNGGYAVGAYDHGQLVGFGVLGNKFRGKNKDQLHIDMLYVSKDYRRQGIGRQLMNELSTKAINRGAKYLYISSTETQSAVHFYQGIGSELVEEVDPELFELEPHDIHMLKKL
jgi:ribosomal protein S18 acetylase RimI-like enzyme